MQTANSAKSSDSSDWLVFEKVGDQDRYVVLINPTKTGKDYRFHQDWFPHFLNSQLIFWSDGPEKERKDESDKDKHTYGMVVLRQKRS